MVRSRAFSIYLLKEGYDASNSLKEKHALEQSIGAGALPPNSTLFVLDGEPRPPWWKEYFNVNMTLNQASKGALVFLPAQERVFALSFGYVSNNLKDESYEYDFGLKVTLNCVDPNELKNTDVLEPGTARRRRTQLSVGSDLTYFDFDRDSTVLRSLTGKVKAEYQDLIKHVTGASNLRINSPVKAAGLVDLCDRLLEIYDSDAYRTTFPDIQNIVPVRDPATIGQLIGALESAVRSKADDIHLAVPEIVNYNDNLFVAFSGKGRSLIYENVSIERYYEYLADNSIDTTYLTIEDLKQHDLQLTNEEGVRRQSYSIFRSLIFDTKLIDQSVSYHLTEGQWYQIDQNYLRRLEEFLDTRWSELDLPQCTQHLENEYSEYVASGSDDFVCLDKTNISPRKQTQVEPCDVYRVKNGRAILIHIKISTSSSELSHLFNQGTNSVELLKSEQESTEKLAKLIRDRVSTENIDELIRPVQGGQFEVIFAIITQKDKHGKSTNLPLFSRISLMRNLKALKLMGIPTSFGFIDDISTTRPGRVKPRKSRIKPNKGA